jgi:diaminopimelate epimerase
VKVSFVKMVASGNDFVLVDNRRGEYDTLDTPLIRSLCTRRLAIGADGLILLEGDGEFDFSMRYFNSDGHEASMCGNGGRCVALFARSIGIAESEMTFRAKAGVYSASIESDHGEWADVTLSMPDPTDIRPSNVIRVEGESITYGSIDTGVPHVVLKVEDLDSFDVDGMGRRIRRHPNFRERGTNVDFIEITENNLVRVRTYERGVEGETLSCGTGAVASAIMASIWSEMTGPVVVKPASGEDLRVSFERADLVVKRVELRGPARVAYRGTVSPA